MSKRIAMAAVLALLTTGTMLAAAAPPDMILPLVGLPLSGATRTTFRFVVRNIGQNPVNVAPPFAGNTRLLVNYPDGQKREIAPKSSASSGVSIGPGHARAWDVDVANWVQFTQPGQYTIWFSMNGNDSNRVVLIKD
jgi:hypothetical protein